MKQYISELLRQSIEQLSPEEAVEVLGSAVFDVTHPKRGFGDFSSNAAMVLFKKFKTAPAANPPALAARLADLCRSFDHQQTFSTIEAAGGFINFTLSPQAMAGHIAQLQQGIDFSHDPETYIGNGRKVVFEYSSPNTNKPLHIGHVRNDVYGKACINLLKAVGYDVISCEIINDRGIHIMKSVLMYMKHGNNETPDGVGMKPDHFVGKYYRLFGQKASESEQIEKQLLADAQELLVKWENNDPEVRAIWKQMNQWFFDGAKQTYEQEGTTFDEVDFESQIYDKGRELVLAGVEQGVFQKEADGSVSVTFAEEHLGKKYLLRKDGTTIYITQDMYLWDQRNKRHSPDIAIVTTATEQAYHFEVLSRIFALLGYPWARNFKHLPYEHVYLGKDKMSSRSGNSITADDLLESVKQRVRQTMAGLERLKGSAEDDALVEAVAYGAIKYGYLQFEPNTRIYFDIEKTIALDGNTGPYIQYAYARIHSIVAKVGEIKPAPPVDLTHPAEIALMRELTRYTANVALAAAEYKPNILCAYLFNLAGTFNNFYANVSVSKEQDANLQGQRITVLLATANVLANGLQILGIEAPNEM